MENKISWEQVKSGQVAPYKDSISEYVIEAKIEEEKVKDFCTKFLHPCKNECQLGCYTGSCGFPFGLETYYRLTKRGEGNYVYTVCSPYCG